MSQHDLDIANQGFPATRADINNALQALGSSNSGATAPSTTYANQLWYDTANNIVKIRNEDNDAWISLLTLDQTADAVTQIDVDNIRIDGNTISSTDTNGDITLDPNGTGDVSIGNLTFDADQTVGSGQDNYVLTYDHSTTSIGLEEAAGGGKILQVIEATKSTSFSTTSSTFQDTGLSATITPSSTSSRILCLLDGQGGQTASGRSCKYRLVRGATQIALKDNLQTGATDMYFPMPIMDVDSPATTSATTYKIQVSTDGVGTVSFVAGSSSYSRLILMEVAG
jgi:hypothetical protein